MRRRALAMFATAIFVAAISLAAPAMANHNHHHYRAGYRGLVGYGCGPSHSSYSRGHRRGAYYSPVYPYYPAPAYGFGYGNGPGYPYYNNYLFGFGGAH